MNIEHYTYRVTWSPEDQEHVGFCAEFPSLSWLSPNKDEAFLGIFKVVAETVNDMQSNGETIPMPLSEKYYSGEFTVRTLPAVHHALALQAAELNVSLNRLVNYKIDGVVALTL